MAQLSAKRRLSVHSLVYHNIEVTTTIGKVLPAGRIQPKLLADIKAGIKTVIPPAENEPDVRFLPDYMRDRVEVMNVREIGEVLE